MTESQRWLIAIAVMLATVLEIVDGTISFIFYDLCPNPASIFWIIFIYQRQFLYVN